MKIYDNNLTEVYPTVRLPFFVLPFVRVLVFVHPRFAWSESSEYRGQRAESRRMQGCDNQAKIIWKLGMPQEPSRSVAYNHNTV